jgi:hypothetical protein
MSRLRCDSSYPRARSYQRLRLVGALLLACVGLLAASSAATSQASRRPVGHRPASKTSLTSGAASRADCIYAANSISVLHSVERLVHHRFTCVLVYNNAAPDWQSWENPWFLTDSNPGSDHDWQRWAHAPGTHRQLIISNNMFPSEADGTDWLAAGAAGEYIQYARRLARNLVAAGLGHSVIRLAHEANDTGSPYSLQTTHTALRRWRQFWRRTVMAMRSVRRAHFLFDWCINAYWRPIPMKEWYPGDDVVNVIGIDAYDSGVPVGDGRWARIYTQPDGIRDVLTFARAHRKPVSLPEWGLEPAGAGTLGGGADPAYINEIADVVRTNRVAYQSYFYNHDSAELLSSNPASLRAYRRHFGRGGDTVGAGIVSGAG